MTIASIILAAGMGTRMKSRTPKMLHKLLGKPLVLHSLSSVIKFSTIPPVIVVGHGSEEVTQVVRDIYGEDVQFALQAEQLGTGHAVMSAEPLLAGKSDLVLVTLADMPMLREETIAAILKFHQESGNVLTMTSVVGDVPRGFGRVTRDEEGKVIAIVEEAVATPEQLKVREYNISVYCFEADWLWENLKNIKTSPKGEYYLTDLVGIAVQQNRKLDSFVLQDPTEGLGINDRTDLADCELAMRKRVIRQWMLEGVTFLDPESCTVESDVSIGQDTIILPNTHLRGSTRIGENCRIGPDTTLTDTTTGDDCMVTYSVAENAILGNHVSMGPFCHLRKGAVLGDRVHLGNFGEVKDSVLAEDVRMGHFSYIGNAKIGKNVNIGAGTITCNYDGKTKHSTEIGENTFIGSDTMLVAPIKIGKNAKTGAGAVVTRDVPDDTLVYGVPAHPKERKE
ncbi:MAG: bifunctional UDP-N-acetylglucosamine diphosphorylase/glucosamine-1-phosphate N-acetyltransferase GlmU [Anaerolineaceae bacterium]|nr:bifunctional UDP-N-acetylglucosamine diphosphorylase/glucosamine-1-phosphate N-acetyltransferase GlmU [Anaerolineaceae bacterium]MDD4042651.1 bifunctional UDP-N-acetylglucosamine diphosphorylase/glucosamine-1-phosphate N-acetyltransferase GlmU [Anaerolineaceae bacterium]MDD4578864.1 bifunctional UDP-N-acetylglucosamine diphosphorylase/glucosamine-1-phosphate N-acetyltransferase GlmU [Anaerolineaceae bacterium]